MAAKRKSKLYVFISLIFASLLAALSLVLYLQLNNDLAPEASKNTLPYSAEAGAGVQDSESTSGETAGADPAKQPAKPQQPPKPQRTVINFLAMGDMLPHQAVVAEAKEADGYNFGKYFEPIKSELEQAHLTFCNQEVPSAGEELGLGGYPIFNAPTEFAAGLKEAASCDLINIANNHIADKGYQGIVRTREAWDEIEHSYVAGANRNEAEQQEIAIIEQDGVKIAFLAFAEFSNLPASRLELNYLDDTELVESLVSKARAEADVVIVSAHWGDEDSHQVNEYQRTKAQWLADLGADVIIGTGPHVLQEAQWLQGSNGKTLCWYSLGNMLSTQLSLAQRTGVLAGFEIVKEGDEIRIENPVATLTYMHYDWSAADEANFNLGARHNLSINLLEDSNELLARTRFNKSAEENLAESSEILGDVVQVR